MKHERLKNYLKLGILLFGISLSLISCKQDDIEIPIEQENSKYFLTRIQTNEFKENLKLNEKISKLKTKSKNSNSQARYENQTFDIDLNEATYIENLDGSYHSYTFNIYNDQDNHNINNIVLSMMEDGNYEADLVTYSLTEEERNLIDSGIEIDLLDKMTIEPFDINQINTYSRIGGCWELVKVGEEDCSCHDVHAADGCTHPDDVYEWQQVDCGGGGSTGGTDDGSGGSDSTGGGGSSSGSSDGSDPKATSLTGTDGTEVRDPCKNMRELFLQYPEYQQILVDLAATVNEDHENAVGMHKDGTEFEESGTALQPFVELTLNPASEYIAIAHTHYETDTTPEQDTYSIFSPNDLQFYYQRLKDNRLDHRKFVAFLITGKGTRYALTIANKSKYLDFFRYVTINEKWQNGLASTQEETDYVINTIVPIFDKYFDKEGSNPAPIKKENTDNQEVLEAFLQFMDEANMGVELFSVDETFTNYTKLNYDESEEDNIRESGCN